MGNEIKGSKIETGNPTGRLFNSLDNRWGLFTLDW